METQDVATEASVLLAFRVENVRSFRDRSDFSLLATGIAEKQFVRHVAWREGGQSIGVLPVAGIFGSNASGKTNVLRSMNDMRNHVLLSFRHGNPAGGVPRRAFMLDPAMRNAPSTFEIDLVLDGVRHEYGFTFNDEEFTEEWVYRYPRGRAALLFHRRGLQVEFPASERSLGNAITRLLRPNALFLSTAASANHNVLLPLYSWFGRNLLLAEENTRPLRQAFTRRMLDDDRRQQEVLALLHAADLGVRGARNIELDPVMKERMQRAIRILNGVESDLDVPDDGPSFSDLGIHLIHQGFDGAELELPPNEESLGTLTWFGLIGPVLDALADGSVFLADELDSSLHPALVAQLVRMFQDPVTNPRRGQLIFNSHDATLLGDAGDRLLGRDQVWFTEKLNNGSTRLYPLTDLDPRKQESIGRRYLAGRYGATPILSDQEFDAVGELITAGAAG